MAYNVAFYFLCEDVKILSAAEKVASLLPNPEAPLGGTDRPPSFFFVLFCFLSFSLFYTNIITFVTLYKYSILLVLLCYTSMYFSYVTADRRNSAAVNYQKI